MKTFLLSYFLFCVCFFSFFASGYVDSLDGLQYLAIARRIYYDHTLEMPEASFDQEENIYLSVIKTPEGKRYAITGLGFSLALLPAVMFEDVFVRLSGTEPIAEFPLQHDWPVLLAASMTNAFFGAWLAVGLYQYLRAVDLPHRSAHLLSFFLIVTSNLFVYTKHVFAQMVFTSFLVWVFYLLKRYSQSNQVHYLFWSAICFGVVMLSYNVTFVYPLPALAVYYVLLTKPRLSITSARVLVRDLLVGLLGVAPFALTYIWYNQLRTGATGVGETALNAQSHIQHFPPAYAILEGLWGLLFSPGKSVFLFSPLLVILVIFWFKFPKKYWAEVVSFGLLFVTYTWFIASFVTGSAQIWHGDSSWGPRYLVPTLPFLLILVGLIIQRLSRMEKIVAVTPLAAIGLGLNVVGLLLPYQLRFGGLPTNLFINDITVHVTSYANEMPRFSPVFNMSKILAKRLLQLRKTYDHGQFNLRLVEGVDEPFEVGCCTWRGLRTTSLLMFDTPESEPLTSLSLQLRNHQIDLSSSVSATLRFSVNGLHVQQTEIGIEEKKYALDLSDVSWKTFDNQLEISSQFATPSAARLNSPKQVLFLQIVEMNGQAQPLATIDFPYVSRVSAGLQPQSYRYWDSLENRAWPIWRMHSRVYEQTFDMWWLRPLHYWDLPKMVYAGLLALIVTGLGLFGYMTAKNTHL